MIVMVNMATLMLLPGIKAKVNEYPFPRGAPFFRKFQTERKNFRINETVSLDNCLRQSGPPCEGEVKKKRGGGTGLGKRKMYQNSLIKNQKLQFIPYCSVQSDILMQLLSVS